MNVLASVSFNLFMIVYVFSSVSVGVCMVFANNVCACKVVCFQGKD